MTNPLKLSNVRINITTKSGGLFKFDLYMQPAFDESAACLVSSCGRVTVIPHKVEIGEQIILVKDQFHVFVNGKRVPDRQFTIAYAQRPKMARRASQYKHTGGRFDASVFSSPVVDDSRLHH
jgi:hypothetical protein